MEGIVITQKQSSRNNVLLFLVGEQWERSHHLNKPKKGLVNKLSSHWSEMGNLNFAWNNISAKTAGGGYLLLRQRLSLGTVSGAVWAWLPGCVAWRSCSQLRTWFRCLLRAWEHVGTYEGFCISPGSRNNIDAFVQGEGSVLFILRIFSLIQSEWSCWEIPS